MRKSFYNLFYLLLLGSLAVGLSVPSHGASSPKLTAGKCTNVGSDWKTVELPHYYDSMIVVASSAYSTEQKPAVVRVRRCRDNKFQVKMQMPGARGASVRNTRAGDVITELPKEYSVHYVVAEEGVYNEAEHGIKMEAASFVAEKPDHSGKWAAVERSYQNKYKRPVVLGQVMSHEDKRWSVFWARGEGAGQPPGPFVCRMGYNVGEDRARNRKPERIGYIVLEEGKGESGTTEYLAAVGSDSIGGVHEGGTYGFSADFSPDCAVVSMAGMQGGNGGWPVLRGEKTVTEKRLKVSVVEDQISDADGGHTSENIAYLILKEEDLNLMTESAKISL